MLQINIINCQMPVLLSKDSVLQNWNNSQLVITILFMLANNTCVWLTIVGYSKFIVHFLRYQSCYYDQGGWVFWMKLIWSIPCNISWMNHILRANLTLFYRYLGKIARDTCEGLTIVVFAWLVRFHILYHWNWCWLA